MKMGDFVRLKDGRIARVFSATQVLLLDGSRVLCSQDEFPILAYTEDFSQLLNAVFDLAANAKVPWL